MGFSSLAFSIVSKISQNPKLIIDDSDNLHFKQQLELDLEDQTFAGTSKAGRILRNVLQLRSKTERSSVILVACIVIRGLILRAIVHGVECSSVGVEV